VNFLRIAARISAIPLESGIRHKDKTFKFSLSEFKSLSSSLEMNEYSDERLQKLGEGSSRICYAMTGSKVLKIAKSFRGVGVSDAGIAQNQAEVDIYTNPKTKSVCTKIFDYDPEFRWVMSEIVRPIIDSLEFKSRMGVDIYNFSYLSQLIIEDNMSSSDAYNKFVDDFSLNSREPITEQDKQSCKKAISILNNLKDSNLKYEDLTIIGHWGISASGNVVLLDYGFTTGVYEEFYREQGTGT